MLCGSVDYDMLSFFEVRIRQLMETFQNSVPFPLVWAVWLWKFSFRSACKRWTMTPDMYRDCRGLGRKYRNQRFLRVWLPFGSPELMNARYKRMHDQITEQLPQITLNGSPSQRRRIFFGRDICWIRLSFRFRWVAKCVELNLCECLRGVRYIELHKHIQTLH